MKRFISIWLCLALVASSSLILLPITNNVKASILYVGGVGPSNYTTIQLAIDNAMSGDTIYVYSGTYNGNLIVNKQLTLIGENKTNTVIDAHDTGHVIDITANGVNITGFLITNSTEDWNNCIGVNIINADFCNISNNIFTRNIYSVFLDNSDNNLIVGNNISADYNIYTHYGVYCTYSHLNIIEKNHFWHLNGRSILLDNSDENNLQNNYLNNTGDFYISESDVNYITNNHFRDCGYEIEIWDSNENYLVNNTIINTTNYYDIQIQRSTNHILESNKMEGGIMIFGSILEQWNTHSIPLSNTVKNKSVFYLKNTSDVEAQNIYGQLILANCINITVVNHTYNQIAAGILMGFTSNSNINNNSFTECGYGISARCYSDNNIFTGNYFYDNGRGISIEYWSNNSVIVNNTCIDNWAGIYLYDEACFHHVENNELFENYYGIRVEFECVQNEIISNLLDGNNYGMWLRDCDYGEISHNIISNSYNGVYCLTGNDQNTISNNLVKYSSSYGIYLQSATNDNTLNNNTLLQNKDGIRIATSSNNKIYENNFLFNQNQAYDQDDSYPNLWDNGYPSGGNYWSDYTGVDLYSTPAQNVPPPDGIGDTPYLIDITTRDNYPLMKPVNLEIYEIMLTEGWNLISLPLIQIHESIDSVLYSIDGKWNCIQVYNSTDQDHWKSNKTFRPDQLNDLGSLDHKIGIWINITGPNVILTVYGYESISTAIPLHAGWNLVGYPSLSNETIGNALWGTGADRVEVFDPAEPYLIKEIGPTYIMQPGEGYWVHVPADTVWVVDW